ncbi:uncharacterized protein LOC114973900 isoform X1 [Acropora millepora]|uniref:uncharacterized protein LOC114973900 isoform X1 n=1 Tax=Acropora millepora TaxID=45264 RepID=UPI001CF1DA87|nr:uncharacterized protein LOC114973900 isoform X1 [Acropora millepora]
MLEATSFEKINAVKKWTGMQNKQCNGICPFNSSDLLQLKRPPDLQKCSVVLIESLLSSRFIDTVHPSNFRRSSCTEMCNLQAFMQICLTRFLDTEDVNLQWNAGLI